MEIFLNVIKLNANSSNFNEFSANLLKQMFAGEPPVIFCIGTDKATGDCFAPLVGTILSKNLNINTFVYGTLKNPITAKNITEWWGFVKTKHPDRKILSIDACLCDEENVGFVGFKEQGIKAGEGFGKSLGVYGDYSILGMVQKATDDTDSIFRTPLGLVYSMAEQVSKAISIAF